MNEKLEKAKEIIAKELNYKDWETCINDQPNYKIEGIMDKVAERYHELMDEWISVDTPPTEKGYYLTIVDEMVASKLRGNIEIQDCYEIVLNGLPTLKFQDYVTHWKPLPTPPKQ